MQNMNHIFSANTTSLGLFYVRELSFDWVFISVKWLIMFPWGKRINDLDN